MSSPKRCVPCNADKLLAEFKKRGLTAKQAVEECGYGATAFATSKLDLGISQPIAKILELQYNIRPEDYSPEAEQVESHPVTTQVQSEESLNDLYKVIYTAVYAAVKAVWDGD